MERIDLDGADGAAGLCPAIVVPPFSSTVDVIDSNKNGRRDRDFDGLTGRSPEN